MKKFSFELQDILDYRNFEQEQAQVELGKALAVENDIEKKIQTIAAQYLDLKNKMKYSVDFTDISMQYKYINLLDFQKEELLKQLAEAKLISEEKRKILQECMKKTSALEKMKEKQLDEYHQAVLEENNKELEELSTIKSNFDYLKNNSESN